MADIKLFAGDAKKLRDLAQHLVDAILKPCELRYFCSVTFHVLLIFGVFLVKLAGSSQPALPVEPSPLDEAADRIEEAMTTIEASNRDKQAKLKADCLRRDGFRCIYSGTYDWTSFHKSLVDVPKDCPTADTQCCHIIPFALGRGG